ncbi:MAG: Adenylate kinase [Candidatus Woesebacteria bacterium GW2011_GWA1_39_8]|uniref:Adenylate kinase n=1 Tax=Candidatus Woesebacteria bacterium GW2011_GWA1_39_8 TaxID=1618552 RepID=A0A0G0PXH0_9BACT|nr:MAG: Adenylate kinase [Candidatus Woesebacteria bacterium GW2011_GWA1_39_8]
MTPQTFIFFGPSGSGKGTQAKLLQEELKKKDPERKILYIETGQKFRELASGDSFSAQKIRDIIENGVLLPEFLPIWAFSDSLIQNFSGEEHMFMDGSPRRLKEAEVLDSAIKFYGRENPTIVSIEVSDEWATKLLKNRGRNDDNDEEIKKRLDWYKENVVPAINYFKNNSYYRFLSINGEQTIEEVHQEIMGKVNLS